MATLPCTHHTVDEKRTLCISDMSFVADGSGAYDQLLLPFATVDGINDAGVCVQVTMPGE